MNAATTAARAPIRPIAARPAPMVVASAADLVHRLGGPFAKTPRGYRVACIAHADQHPSLDVDDGLSGPVLKCRAGCSQDALLAALRPRGITLRPPSNAGNTTAARVTRYEYPLPAGGVAVHVREDQPGREKKVWWERDGEKGLRGLTLADLPLYRPRGAALPIVGPVVVCEGEPAAEAAHALGLAAVGTGTGAQSCPGLAALEVLRDRDVVLWPDADQPGRDHMQRLAKRLGTIARSVRFVEWRDARGKDDAADFSARGGTREQAAALIAAAVSEPREVPSNAGGAVLVRVSSVKPERVEWLWSRRLPLGKLAVLDGDPGLGKSTLTLDLAARVSRGRPLPGDDAGSPPAGVVLLTGEDGIADTIRPRLEAARADLDRVVVMTAVRDVDGLLRPPSIPQDVAAIRDACRLVSARLVVIDPLMAYLSGGVDSHRDQDVRGALHQLAELADGERLALLIVRHLNKAGGGHPIYRGGGSIGIIGAARSGLLVAPDPKDAARRVLAVSKSNLGPMPPSLAYRIVSEADASSHVEWEGESGCSARDLLEAQRDDGEDAGRREDAAAFLLELLTAGPVAGKEVQRQAREAGLSDRTLHRAKKQLGVLSRKEGMGGGWVWLLPAEGCHATPKAATPQGWQSSGELATFGARAPQAEEVIR